MTEPADHFFTAIILGDIETVARILPEHPGALTWLTPAGYPPLHMAILNHQDEIAVLLVENGASLSQEAQGETAAGMADRKGLLERLQKASIAGPQRRLEHVEQCGNSMRGGLQKPITVPRRKLSLKKPPTP
jgi:hypothetical protein